jgi:hypothetical protein
LRRVLSTPDRRFLDRPDVLIGFGLVTMTPVNRRVAN